MADPEVPRCATTPPPAPSTQTTPRGSREPSTTDQLLMALIYQRVDQIVNHRLAQQQQLREASLTPNLAGPAASASVATPEAGSSKEATTDMKILRTVYMDNKGGFLEPSSWKGPMTEEEYEKVKETASTSIFEMKKSVKVVPPRTGHSLEDPVIDSIQSEYITVHSPRLLKAIKEVVQYWPSSSYYAGQTKLVLAKPYRSIGVHKEGFDELERIYRSKASKLLEDGHEDATEFQEAAEQISMLMEEVDKVQKVQVAEQKELCKQSPPSATFETLWMLFKPGIYVYTSVDGEEVACRVRLAVWDRGRSIGVDDPYVTLTVHMWCLDHNGVEIDRRHRTVTIDRFNGSRPIVELPVYPETFAENAETKRKERVERGRKYFDLLSRGGAHRMYSGFLSNHSSNPSLRQNHKHYEGKVIVDPYQYFKENGADDKVSWENDIDTGSEGLGAELKQFIKIDPTIPGQRSDDICLLLPKWIRGFSLATKGARQWAFLDVDKIEQFTPNTGLLSMVAVKDSTRERIKALTYKPQDGGAGSSPETIQPLRADSIAGKGEGSIILLHGEPGMGKTYTAECVAEWSNRPLLRLTCAELGLEPNQLEKSLSKYLRRAERWDAIVLIDEADIFLEKRDRSQSLQKAACVAVFLRALEYYSGILILTTNRIRAFDEAVINRMAMIAHYEKLDPAQKKHVRHNCEENIQKDGHFKFQPEAIQAYEEIDNDKDHGWNGREIVSVAKLAAAIAQWDWYGTKAEYRESSGIIIQRSHVAQAIDDVRSREVYFNKKTAKGRESRYEEDELG